MKLDKSPIIALLCASFLAIATASQAADSKSYQVTGPILEVTPKTITVQKGDEKWEVARDKNTKITGELKVGAKVTIYYRMIADEVEVKEGKQGKDAKGEKDGKSKK